MIPRLKREVHTVRDFSLQLDSQTGAGEKSDQNRGDVRRGASAKSHKTRGGAAGVRPASGPGPAADANAHTPPRRTTRKGASPDAHALPASTPRRSRTFEPGFVDPAPQSVGRGKSDRKN